jgi:hypothetical protein
MLGWDIFPLNVTFSPKLESHDLPSVYKLNTALTTAEEWHLRGHMLKFKL